MSAIIFQEWRDSNRYSNYPFSDVSTFKTLANTLVLKNTLIDANVHIIGGEPPFYIRTVTPITGGTKAEIRIAAANSSLLGYSAYGVVDTAISSDVVKLLDIHGRDSGILILNAGGAATIVALANSQELRFRPTGMEFVANVCTPLPDVGFRGFILPDGTTISGSIVMAGENGVVLTEEDDAIRINVVGDPYYSRNCLEEQNIPVAPMCAVKTINGILPDINGDFKLTTGSYNASDTALRIFPVEGGVEITLLS